MKDKLSEQMGLQLQENWKPQQVDRHCTLLVGAKLGRIPGIGKLRWNAQAAINNQSISYKNKISKHID